MKLYIKNMVCSRCKMVVKSELLKLGLHPTSVVLGEVEITEDLDKEDKKQLDQALNTFGFELIDDKKSRLIEKIKTVIIDLVHYSEEPLKITFSEHISALLRQDYSYLSNLFSAVEGTTIEQYVIAQKIERVKELLVYDEMTLSEIAYKLHYSDVTHLSKQFKKLTGLTPSHFKNLKNKKRNSLENL